MEFTPEKKKKLAKWLIGIAAACILIFLGVQNIGTVASAVSWVFDLVLPLVIGCAVAMIVNVPMRAIEARLWKRSEKKFAVKLRRPVALILSILFIVGVLAGVVRIVLPELVEAVGIIVDAAVEIVDKFHGMTEEDILALPFGDLILDINWDKLLDSLKTWAMNESNNIANTVFGTLTSLVGGIIDLFVALVFGMYILISKDKLKRGAERIVRVWLPKVWAERVCHAVSVANVNFRSFITGQTIEAFILGVLCLIGMWIFGFPYAPMISTLIGVTALVPVIGAFAGGGIGAFMILTVDPMQALFFIIYLLALQQLEENLIYPRVMGSHVNLPGMWVLAAITVGGGVAGPVGMLIGVPLASTVYTLFGEATAKREAKKLMSASVTEDGSDLSEHPSERENSIAVTDALVDNAASGATATAPEKPHIKSNTSHKNKKKKRK